MPNSTAFDFANVIQQAGIGTFSKHGNFPLITVGYEPDVQRRTLITIYDTGGPASNPAYQRDFPRIQIRVKSADEGDYPQAYNPQQSIKDLLLGMDRWWAGETLYVGCWQTSDIATLSSGYNQRTVIVSSYRTAREYPTANRLPIE